MFPRLLFSSPIHSSRTPPICQLETLGFGGRAWPTRAPARGRALAVAPNPAGDRGSGARTRAAAVGEASSLMPALGASLLLTRAATRPPLPATSGVSRRGNCSVTAALWTPDPGRTGAPAVRRWTEATRWWWLQGSEKFPCRGWKPGGEVCQQMGVPAEGLRVRTRPRASRPWEEIPPSQSKREAATVSPCFVLTARLENASVGRLDGRGAGEKVLVFSLVLCSPTPFPSC